MTEKKYLSKQHRDEQAKRKRQKAANHRMNKAIQNARGTSVTITGKTPKGNKAMGQLIRGKKLPLDPENMTKAQRTQVKRDAIDKGYMLADDLVTILYDSRPGKKGTLQKEVA